MRERVLQGAPASPGAGLGAAWRRADQIHGGALVPWEDHERERDAALAALATAAEELSELAAGLPDEEAAIIEAGVLMARDPALVAAVEEAILSQGRSAADAVLQATERHAAAIAEIDDPTLSARADDVRSLGQRAARLAGRENEFSSPDGPVILIAEDLGPADVVELAPVLAGIALAGGGRTAHAAIVARSLGVPMVTGLGPAVVEIVVGTLVALDGTTGSLALSPAPARRRAAAEEMAASTSAAERSAADRDLPAISTDGRRVAVLANIATVGEVEVALRLGAEGIGLLRTELAFLEASDWPAEADHANELEPILAAIGDRPATVRVLDFGADKSPPFLRGGSRRGLELLLANPEAFTSQLRAILARGHGRDVRILLPMVDGLAQLTATRNLIDDIARSLGLDGPPVGAMIETPAAAESASALAGAADFLSIGTNDLTATVLGADRFAAGDAHAHHPRVLRAIAGSVDAAHAAGIEIEVCGEAASDPLMLALLVGLGVDELSVGVARVGAVRDWVRRMSYRDAQRLSRSALAMDTADQVAAAAAPLAGELQSAQAGDAAGERIKRNGRVSAFGA